MKNNPMKRTFSSFILHRSSFVLAAVVALVWANLPYLIGYAVSTPQTRFGGFFLYEQDGYSYLAKMRQGALGAWEFHLPYTSEDEYQTGGFTYVFYLAAGRLAALGLDYAALYHLTRLAGSILLLIALARFIRRFVRSPRWQVWAWWLILFSGGWGILISYLNPTYVAYEIVAPDAFVFSILYGPPHVILGFALLLFWIGTTLDTLKPDAAHLPQRLVIGNIIGGLATLSRESYAPVFAGVFAAYLIALIGRRRRVPWREGVLIVLSAITAGLYSVYLLIAFRTIPGFVVWSNQNPFVTPDLFDFVIGFAPLIALGVWGWQQLSSLPPRHQDTKNQLTNQLANQLTNPPADQPRAFVPLWLFMVAWAIAGPILAYLPLPISRRLIAGWQIPVCILGAYALLHLIRSRARFRHAIASVLLASTVPTTILVIAGGSAVVALRPSALFQSADQLAALDWLSRNTTASDVVLSDWRFGNQIPVYTSARVFIGHPFETAHYTDKLRDTARVLDPNTPEADRYAILARWSITLVVVGPESTLILDPEHYTPVFTQGVYSIYRIR